MDFENNFEKIELDVRSHIFLQSRYQKILKQWHTKKNGKLRFRDLKPFSNISVWWRCENGHEWKTQVRVRMSGHNCPFCFGMRPTKEKTLWRVNPELAKEWHPTKNGNLSPKDVSAGCGKKVWWLCPNGEDHEWLAVINDRNYGRGCPFCAGRRASNQNRFSDLFPQLAKQWDFKKNEGLRPELFTITSVKEVWWKCEKNHSWKAKIKSRTMIDNNCPKCKSK